MTCLGIKSGLISLPGHFYFGLGIFKLAWAQARMKIPRQTYFANFDTQAANRQLELCIRGGIGGRPPQSNSTRVTLKNTFLLQIQSFHAALNSSNLAFISSLILALAFTVNSHMSLLPPPTSCYQKKPFDMAWVFSFWPGHFQFGLGPGHGLGIIGPSTNVRTKKRKNLAREFIIRGAEAEGNRKQYPDKLRELF